jgi:hypothetical protein
MMHLSEKFRVAHHVFRERQFRRHRMLLASIVRFRTGTNYLAASFHKRQLNLQKQLLRALQRKVRK